ncbi:hypothetical protein RUM44_007246 [Polyplax serrata]|uniref:Uncharacterized protein n=1 Tax=Polyplax serrata TaxID=468196 RepID=A0ABR1B051_POLSC
MGDTEKQENFTRDHQPRQNRTGNGYLVRHQHKVIYAESSLEVREDDNGPVAFSHTKPEFFGSGPPPGGNVRFGEVPAGRVLGSDNLKSIDCDGIMAALHVENYFVSLCQTKRKTLSYVHPYLLSSCRGFPKRTSKTANTMVRTPCCESSTKQKGDEILKRDKENRIGRRTDTTRQIEWDMIGNGRYRV